VFDQGLPALNAARAALGLTPLATLVDQFRVARKSLIAVSRTFDFGPQVDPPGYRYVGPQLDELPWADPWVSPWAADDPRPLALVGFSTTFQNHVDVLQKVIDAVASLPVRALVTLGPTIEPRELRTTENVHLVASAPHNEVMRRATLVVTHGGHGTVARAMVNHLPMLVIPHGRDQDGNAARITAHGAGLTLPPTATSAQIHEALSNLLQDGAFGEAARRLGEAVAREMRTSDVVRELEELCWAIPSSTSSVPRNGTHA
jgi:MGT family glycosyltransferase